VVGAVVPDKIERGDAVSIGATASPSIVQGRQRRRASALTEGGCVVLIGRRRAMNPAGGTLQHADLIRSANSSHVLWPTCTMQSVSSEGKPQCILVSCRLGECYFRVRT
jgi:hypothetical protein